MSLAALSRVEQLGVGYARFGQTIGQIVIFINNTSQSQTVYSTTLYRLITSPTSIRVGASLEFYWNGRYYQEIDYKFNGTFSVVDFGADPTGVLDSYAAFTAATAAVSSLGGELQIPAGTYLFNTEWLVNGVGNIRVQGAHVSSVILKAGTPGMRSVVCLANGSNNIKFADLTVDANRKANFGICLKGCGYSNFDRMQVSNALFDGIQAQIHQTDETTSAINQFNKFWDVSTYRCGIYFGTNLTHLSNMASGYGVATQHITGTVSTTSGSPIVTGVSTLFTTLGLRTGDVFGISSNPLGDKDNYCTIETVDSNTQLTLATPFRKSLSAQDYILGRGGGLYEVKSGNIGLSSLFGGLHRSHSGAALGFGGLYGPNIFKPQIDFCGTYGMRVGEVTATPCYGTRIETPYFEAMGSGIGIKSISGQIILTPGITNAVDSDGSAQAVTIFTDNGMSSPIDEFMANLNTGVFLGLDVQNQSLQYVTLGTSVADGSASPTAFLLIVGTKLKDYVNQVKKLSVRVNGDVEVHTAGAGIIVASPNGTRFRIQVDNAGVLSAVAI